MIVAHKSADGRLQPLEEHLRNVAEYAKRFSEVFEAGEYAYVLGLAHDIGKYSAEFQDYLLNEGTGGVIPRRARRNCFDYGCYRRRYVRPGIMRDFPTGAGQEIRQGSPPGRGV